MFFKPQIHLNKRIPTIIHKIDDKIKEISSIYIANPKANYLNSIKQNISNDVLKEYTDLYTGLVIRVKDVHDRECMNQLSSETKVILFYELCKLIQSSFHSFCEEDAKQIGSDLLQKRCNPNHKQFTDNEQKRISEDKKKLTKQHISFIPIKDIFIAILLYYCECNKTDISETVRYMLEYIFPKIESELSIFLHFMISNSETGCKKGGKHSLKQSLKRSDIQKKRKYKKRTRKHI